MITLNAKFKPDENDPDATGRAAVAATLEKLKLIENLAEEIQDPQTGEHPKISWINEPDGMRIKIDGSDFVVAEMRKRVEALSEDQPRA